jgi:pyruvate/oxaloacetate carboxyltransferase
VEVVGRWWWCLVRLIRRSLGIKIDVHGHADADMANSSSHVTASAVGSQRIKIVCLFVCFIVQRRDIAHRVKGVWELSYRSKIHLENAKTRV